MKRSLVGRNRTRLLTILGGVNCLGDNVKHCTVSFANCSTPNDSFSFVEQLTQIYLYDHYHINNSLIAFIIDSHLSVVNMYFSFSSCTVIPCCLRACMTDRCRSESTSHRRSAVLIHPHYGQQVNLTTRNESFRKTKS